MGFVSAVSKVQSVLRPGVANRAYEVLREGVGAPILIQSGFSMEPKAHPALIRELAKTGRPVLGVPAPCRTMSDVDELATRFGTALKAAYEDTGERATVVVHSYGGVISRKFMQENEGYRYADQLISIGSPHSGMDFFHPLLDKLASKVPIPGLQSLSASNGPARELNAGLASFMADAHAYDENFQIVSLVGKGLFGGDGLVPSKSTAIPLVRGVHTATFANGIWRNHASQAGIGPKLDPRVGETLLRLMRPTTGVEPLMSAKLGVLHISPAK